VATKVRIAIQRGCACTLMLPDGSDVEALFRDGHLDHLIEEARWEREGDDSYAIVWIMRRQPGEDDAV
jgi:hypothetical protein